MKKNKKNEINYQVTGFSSCIHNRGETKARQSLQYKEETVQCRYQQRTSYTRGVWSILIFLLLIIIILFVIQQLTTSDKV